ncbi:MAG: acetate--CoA ligase family protein [Bacteroidales bacterium]|nr:acetate--CoA ligase family protein [Bacteroidales bacterium]
MIRIPATTPQNLITDPNGSNVNPPIDKETIDDILAGSASATLPNETALRLLDAIGISRDRSLIATTLDEAREAVTDIGFPVNMEAISLHDGESKVTIEHITDRNTMRLEFERLMKDADTNGVLIRPSLYGATAYFGIRKKAGHGHVVVCGAVSKKAEKPSGFMFCTLPVTKEAATQAYNRVKGEFQINEVLFTDAIRRLSALCSYAPAIDKMDIYPVIVNARNLMAMDAAVSIDKSI